MGEKETLDLDRIVLKAIENYTSGNQKVTSNDKIELLQYDTSLGKAIVLTDFNDLYDKSYGKNRWAGVYRYTYKNDPINVTAQYKMEPNTSCALFEMMTGRVTLIVALPFRTKTLYPICSALCKYIP